MTPGRYASLPGVRKIAVLRPNAVGDFVFALPALHALRAAYPEAELVLLGRDWHAAFLAGRPGPVDRVVVVPPLPGIGLPADAPGQAIADFVGAMRAEKFDIACQMYGGGRYANPLVAAFGARLAVGARAEGAPALERWVRYAEPANRRLALLEVAALAGANTFSFGDALGNELALTEADRHAAAAVLAPEPGERLVVLQPGSTDPRRRWPARSFALVGDALARLGARVVVNGSVDEASLAGELLAAMAEPALDLSGRLGLGGLCGLLARAALVVSNDTGPLHLALALGRPCVGVFWLTNLIDGAPLRQGLLRVALALRVDCPVCGMPNLRSRCAHDASFVADVPADEVIELAMAALRDAS
ncbi:glycosyltransferase family 9 protein [Massilia haematophila]|uniref:Glycosyltransferase family 9 protein n=1 Tax=Massilia haematophila TaxID=457923 RepID=A0ABV7PMK5_9BURK